MLLEVVSEKTGYPAEMLNADMGLDADLGIDSISASKSSQPCRKKLPEAPGREAGARGANTLRQIGFRGRIPLTPIASPRG